MSIIPAFTRLRQEGLIVSLIAYDILHVKGQLLGHKINPGSGDTHL